MTNIFNHYTCIYHVRKWNLISISYLVFFNYVNKMKVYVIQNYLYTLSHFDLTLRSYPPCWFIKYIMGTNQGRNWKPYNPNIWYMEFGLPVLPYMKNNIYTKLDFGMFVGMYHIVVVVIAILLSYCMVLKNVRY